jgi:hypothetical protein
VCVCVYVCVRISQTDFTKCQICLLVLIHTKIIVPVKHNNSVVFDWNYNLIIVFQFYNTTGSPLQNKSIPYTGHPGLNLTRDKQT